MKVYAGEAGMDTSPNEIMHIVQVRTSLEPEPMSVATQPGQVAMMVKPSSFSELASTAVSVIRAGHYISAEIAETQHGEHAEDQPKPTSPSLAK